MSYNNKPPKFRYLQGSDYDRAKELIDRGVTEIDYICPYCNNPDVTLWLTDDYDGIRVPMSLKCGECDYKFEYTIPAPSIIV